MKPITIRPTTPDDQPALRALYAVAFPDEDLWPLLTDLLPSPAVISFAACEGAVIAGHILFTQCSAARDSVTGEPEIMGALLGPLAVAPDRQRKGIGSMLIQNGLAKLKNRGIQQVFVLGDPGYYGRLAFIAERTVLTPCPIPDEWAPAWQSVVLSGGEPPAPGRLRVPHQWMDPALWAP